MIFKKILNKQKRKKDGVDFDERGATDISSALCRYMSFDFLWMHCHVYFWSNRKGGRVNIVSSSSHNYFSMFLFLSYSQCFKIILKSITEICWLKIKKEGWSFYNSIKDYVCLSVFLSIFLSVCLHPSIFLFLLRSCHRYLTTDNICFLV